MDFFNFETEIDAEIRQMKYNLASYLMIDIKNVDLDGTNFKREYYSDNLTLYRSHEDTLMYLTDNQDVSTNNVELVDLKVILGNVAFRRTNQKKQAIELERFLSE
ncbi:hypothetical protein J7E52_10685 [Bacillus sp. ISL-34]|uniref:hypothetical protein n=1 Tax=Bacillus sp. ISL-34 TaxID=2819121 RepID=UPI001BE53AC5|nr:hypothetical protein [Bacillus sp. ISL-34]MBT2647182.1 hypothetical protein [Bacillus sp. ISL-34]